MGYLSNVKKQYWISFFNALIPAYVIERLFWQERGLGVQAVVYCEIIYALTVTVLEIPSGMMADIFGRKKLLSVCKVIDVLEFVLLLFAHGFFQFAFIVFLSGVGKALSSGSANALLYDSLLNAGRQDDFEKHAGRISAIDFFGSLIAALSGSILASFFNYEFNYVLSALSMCAAFIFTLSLKEPPMITKPESELSGAAQYVKEAVRVFKSQPLVLIYCLSGAFLGACVIYLDEFWQLILESIGVPVVFFGVVGALEMSLRIPGNLLAYKLKEKVSYKSILGSFILVNAIGYIAIFFTRNLLCLIPIILISLLSGIIDPLISGYLHHRTESRIRATVESFSSLGLRTISIVIGLLFGIISSAYSLFTGFLMLGIICLLYLLLFKVIIGNRREESNA